MLFLCGCEIYSRWVPLLKITRKFSYPYFTNLHVEQGMIFMSPKLTPLKLWYNAKIFRLLNA